MRGTRVAVYVHLVWATWNCLPLLEGERERRIYRCLEATCDDLGVDLLALGGVADHLHLVVRLPATLSVAQVVKRLKGTLSHLATHEISPDEFFKWQGGYGAFSISQRHVAAACAYAARQKAHHAAGTLIAAYEPEADGDPGA